MNYLMLFLKPSKKSTVLGMLFIACLLLVACQKEKLHLQDEANNNAAQPEILAIATSDCEPETTCTDLLCILSDEEDADNHKINMMLYHYAQAVRQAAANPEWLCLMVEAMKGDPDGYGISIADLAVSNPAMAQSVNAALKQSIETHEVFPKEESGMDEWLADPDWDANAYLRSQMVYGTDSYDPVIYFVKTPTSCQTEEAPTIVIAEAVNCEDEVAGWKGETEVLLSETTVKASEELIIFVGPGIPQHFDDPDHKPYVITDAEAVDLSMVDADIDVDRHQIKKGYRYERSGNSDVRGWVMKFFLEDDETHTLSRWEDFKPRKISKKDIDNSKIFTEDLDAFTMDIDDFNNNRYAFIGTWEDDWYASVKVIQNTCSPLIAHSVSIRMKYAHEWYFYDCAILKTWFPSVNAHRVFQNQKCMFDLKRVK